jgi:hypothetical protein
MIVVDETFFAMYEAHRNINLSAQDPARAKLVSRLIEMARNRLDLPIVLPRRVATETHWYFLPRTAPQSRLLREQIRAFLAPPFSDFDGSRGRLMDEDPFDALVGSLFGENAIKVTVGGDTVVRTSVNTAVGFLVDLLEKMPPASFELARPPHRVMSDFEWSLQFGGIEASRRLLQELELFGRLSQENILFLTVRCLAAHEQWHELLHLDGLGDMLRLRMPLGVVHAVIRAVDHEILSIGDEDERTRRLAAEELAALGSLRIGSIEVTPPDVVQAINRLRRALELDDSSGGESTGSLSADSSVVGGHETNRTIEEGRHERVPFGAEEVALLLDLGQFGEALPKCLGLEFSLRRSALLLRIAFADRSPEVVNCVWEDSKSWSESLRNEISAVHYLDGILQWLERQTLDGFVPGSLLAWLESFDSDMSDQKMQEIFDEFSEAWIVNSIDLETAEHLAMRIEQIALSYRSHLLRRNLAFIHRITTGGEGFSGLLVLEACLNALVLEDVLSATELTVLHHLSESILDAAPHETRTRVLTELRNVWDRVATPNRLSWALDIAATIRATAGPGDEQSLNILKSIASRVAAFLPASVDVGLLPLVRLILGDVLDLAASRHIFSLPLGELEPANPFESLSGKKVGIYTTEHRRAVRIRDALGEMVGPSIEVRLNHDLRCTEELKSMSKRCDIVVVLTNAATHSATDCIAGHRGVGPTWLIHATGTSTVLAAMSDYLVSQTS